MRKVRWAIGLAIAALAVAAPAMANATTYCVHQGGTCPAGQSDAGANLQGAMSAAATSSGNTVLIGPGTFSQAGPFQYISATHPVTIAGAGAGETHLRVTGATSEGFEVDGPTQTSVSGLTVDLTTNIASGLALNVYGPSASSGPLVTGVAVTETGSGPFTSYGAALGNGSTLTHSTLGSSVLTQGSVTMSDDTITSTGWGLLADGPLSATRLQIASSGGGVLSEASGDVAIDGLLMRGTGGTGNIGAYATNGGKLTIRSATIAVEAGLWQEAAAQSTVAGTSSLTIVESIFTGFTQGPSCVATAGVANLTFGNDDRHAFGAESCTGGGTFTAGTGNVDADPRFVDPAAGDYRLRFGSPAIDAGGASCNAPCQGSDLDGLIRPIDGNGDGTAVRDMGAYEYGHRAPSVTAAASTPSVTAGQPVAFTAGASDPDDGDSVTLTWTFDDGATASGANVSHAFATAGTHTATVTATDSSGLRASAAATVVVAAPPDRTAPSVGSIHLSHRTFRRGRHAARAAKRSPTGTTISFSLSENATVKLTFAKRDRHHHYKTVRNRSVTLTLKTGKPKISFDGIADHHHRLSTGAYELKLVATDAARNRSRTRTAKFTIASH